MHEFEELLDSLLAEDANPHPPSGMNARIASSLSTHGEYHRKIAKVWYGVAATVLASLALWSFSRSVAAKGTAGSSPPVTILSAGSHSQVGRAAIAAEHISPVRVVFPRRSSRRAVRIAPVEIEPLVMEPIQIAYLTPHFSNKKGAER